MSRGCECFHILRISFALGADEVLAPELLELLEGRCKVFEEDLLVLGVKVHVHLITGSSRPGLGLGLGLE